MASTNWQTISIAVFYRPEGPIIEPCDNDPTYLENRMSEIDAYAWEVSFHRVWVGGPGTCPPEEEIGCLCGTTNPSKL